MKTLLALLSLTSSFALAADFPTGTFTCKSHDDNGKERLETVKITETTLSGISLPVVEYAGPLTAKGIASVTTIPTADGTSLWLALPSSGVDNRLIRFDKGNSLTAINGIACEK